jgi:hypothetical protein
MEGESSLGEKQEINCESFTPSSAGASKGMKFWGESTKGENI